MKVCRMAAPPDKDKPASAPDVIPPRPPAPPEPGSESEGSNATRHRPDPAAGPRPRSGNEGHAPRGPYTTGNT
jgi:hypothetical protein